MTSPTGWRWARRRLANGCFEYRIPGDALAATREWLRAHPEGVATESVETRFRCREEMAGNFRYGIAHIIGEPLPEEFPARELLETLARNGEGDWGAGRDGAWRFTLEPVDLGALPSTDLQPVSFDLRYGVLLSAGWTADDIAAGITPQSAGDAAKRRAYNESWRYRQVWWDGAGIADRRGEPWAGTMMNERPATVGASEIVRAVHVQRNVGNGRWATTDMYMFEAEERPNLPPHGRLVARVDLVAELRKSPEIRGV